jgi:hypothetical protein
MMEQVVEVLRGIVTGVAGNGDEPLGSMMLRVLAY